VQLYKQTICRKCQRPMETVATIIPMGGKPGLEAFLCSACGSTYSSFIYPWHAQVSRGEASANIPHRPV
jgi:hypothetical protein